MALRKQEINPQREELKQKFVDKLQLDCSVSPDEASDKQIYQVLSALMVEKLKHKRQHFVNKTHSVGGKSVYYLSMEFLMGRALGNNMINLMAYDEIKEVLAELVQIAEKYRRDFLPGEFHTLEILETL
mgnify:CR=1 FL=1